MRLLIKCLYLSIVVIGVWGCENGTKNSSESSDQKQPVLNSQRSEFDYKSPEPISGELYAAIELGSLGLNYFIVEIGKEGNWKLNKSFYGRSNIIYGSNNTLEINAEVMRFLEEIRSEGISESNIHIVASSSVIRLNDISSLRKALKKEGFYIQSISAEAEAKYALIATIPKEFIEESFLVDVGSGNSKLSWVSKSDTFSTEIHGSKYFLTGIQDTTVFREVRNALLEIPRRNRNLCFMLGGTIYDFLKEDIQSNDNRYFVLKAPGVYPKDTKKLKAGNVIYSALYLEPTYSYIFDSKSNFSIGYLITKRNQ